MTEQTSGVIGTMNEKQKEDVKALIRFYEERGLDWSSALEFLVRRYNGSLREVIHTRVGQGRPGKDERKLR